jgi:hypothetical protein
VIGATWNAGPLTPAERLALRLAAPMLGLIPAGRLPGLMGETVARQTSRNVRFGIRRNIASVAATAAGVTADAFASAAPTTVPATSPRRCRGGPRPRA